MKQKTLRKLRHRILSGILCFSIVFVGQPNCSKASTLPVMENGGESEQTAEYEFHDVTEEDFNADESVEINTEEDGTEEFHELTEEVFSDEQNGNGTEEFSADDQSENGTEEFPSDEQSGNGTEEVSSDEQSENGTEDSAGDEITAHMEETEIELSMSEENVEPQAEGMHQHSVSTNCSVSTGEQVTFTELNTTGGVLPEGNYYLNNDITLNRALEISGTTNLCLNGHTLRYGGGSLDSVITVAPDVTLNICDCGDTGSITGGKLNGIYIRKGTVNFYGGAITGNSAPKRGDTDPPVLDGGLRPVSGGGVLIVQGTFNMYGGKISNNMNTDAVGTAQGGGVCVGINGSSDITGGTFHMYGGTISENASGSHGGGIACALYTKTVIYGGTISNNTAYVGGGIDVGGGTLLIKDGEISNNTARNDGGGMRIYNTFSRVELSGGRISNNISNGNGGGLCIDAGEFLMSGGEITNNTATSSTYGMGGGIYGACDISGGTISNNKARLGGGVYSSAGSKLSGTPIINGNTNNTDHADNLYIPPAASAVTISDSMAMGANIGVTYESSGTVVTGSPFAIPGSGLDISKDAQYFSCDAGTYGILYKNSPKQGLYFGHGITVTYDYRTNGGSSVSQSSAFVEENSTLDLSSGTENAVTAEKEGWEFLGWNTNPNATDALDTLIVNTENITLYAIYKKTITASFYSGSANEKVVRTITLYNQETDGTITAPALAERSGWQAVGWNPDINGYTGAISEASTITLFEDSDYYGVYQQDITISYDANGGISAPASETKKRYANVHNSVSYQNPVFVLAPAVSRTDYTFDGWHQGTDTGKNHRPGMDVELIGNTTFYAGWIKDMDRSYVVEHYWQDVTGDGYTLIDTVAYTGTAGTEAEAESKTYIGFTENTEYPYRKASGMITEDGSLVLKLYYDRNIYTVNFDLNGAEGTVPDQQSIRYGGKVTPVPEPVWDGYTFTGWYTDMENRSAGWDFDDTIENNLSDRFRNRSIMNTSITLYAGWQKDADSQNITNSQNNTNSQNDADLQKDTGNPTSGKPIPRTGDTAHLELYATAAMIAGLSYLLLELADEQGMTEEKKRSLTNRLIYWAKKGGMLRRIVAFFAMFLLLAYYHSIGKQLSAKRIAE